MRLAAFHGLGHPTKRECPTREGRLAADPLNLVISGVRNQDLDVIGGHLTWPVLGR